MRLMAGYKPFLFLALMVAGCAANPLLMRFNATLNAQDSATLALEQWCAAQRIASPARIEAHSVDDAASSPATPAIRAALGVNADEPVRVRHVLLRCGDVLLSDAHNWYVPARLTPAMNTTLDTTHVPFGKVVAPIGLHRVALTGPAPAACPAGTIRHDRAVLHRDDGVAYSLVSECYTRANLTGR
jgi:hypothetical protein